MTFGAAVALSLLGCASTVHATATASSSSPVDEVSFDTLAIVSDTSGINLLEGSAVVVRTEHEIESTRELLAAGYDGSFAERVVGAIDEVADDRVVLVGVIESGCTPAKRAGLRRDESGEVSMWAPGHVEAPVECVVAVVSVGVLSVDADEVPVGAADGASLAAFEPTGAMAPAERTAVEITGDDRRLLEILPAGATLPELPPLEPAHRRFGFVRSGCANTTAEMIITPQRLDARLGHHEPGLVVNCARAEFYVAVFDVPDGLVRQTAQLAGA